MSAPVRLRDMTAEGLLRHLMVICAHERRMGARDTASDLLIDAYEYVHGIRDRDDATERCGEEVADIAANLY